ncbi:MAG TPA: hypothetical protein VLQ93_14685 [Myxococcaceae bacterium]|nr:hypothetical protein [Myxococcaceae bacterium]
MNPRPSLRRGLPALLLVLAGVALAADENPAISVRMSPARSFNLQLAGDEVFSANVQLHFGPKQIRGRILGQDTLLQKGEKELGGVIGARPARLEVRQEGRTLHAEGTLGRGPVRLRFSPEELHAYTADCTYELKYVHGRYEGPRSCASTLAPPVQVALPEAFFQRSAPEQALLLLLALSS